MTHPNAAHPGLGLLTDLLFDYAGMFPPAQLPLGAALRESARFPRTLQRPTLVAADLVVPFASLAQVDRKTLRATGFGETRCTLCVVGVEVAQLESVVAAVQAFNERNAPLIEVTALEVHGDKFVANPLANVRDQLGLTRLFIEPKWASSRWTRGQAALFDLLGDLKESGAPVGLKVRGVGPTAVSNEILARILPAVARIPIPLKVTQGLHFPVVGAGHDLGFLNLTMALRLSQAHRPTSKQLLAVLRETDPRAYRFDDGAALHRHTLTKDELVLARADLPFTIGSCSLAEPDAELVRLWPEP